LTTTKVFYDRAACIFLLIVLALALRLTRLNLPFFEPYNSIGRQAVGASVARNFYQHGFNFFYPEINENGAGPSLFNLEMPFAAYLAAIGYALAGGVREWVARGVSVLFSMGTLIILYFLTKRLYDKRTALATLLFAAVSPLHLALSRAVQPEEILIFASTGTLAAYYFYQETRKKRFFILSALCLFVAIGSKLYSLYLFIPLLFLGLRVEGKKIFRDPKNYAYLAVSLSAGLWWLAMWRAGQTQELAYSSYHYAVHRAGEGMSYWRVLFHWPYVKILSKVFLVHILTPLGIIFFLAGLLQRVKTKADAFVQIWFWSVVLFMLVFLRAAIQHSYYQAPFIPACAILVGKGARRLFAHASVGRLLRNRLTLTLILICEMASLLYFYRGLYFIPPKFYSILEAGSAVERLTPKDSLVVASHGTSAIQLYYTDRKGWSFGLVPEPGETLIGSFEKLRKKGAAYFVASSREELDRVPEFLEYLRGRYAVVEEKPGYLLFKLNGWET